MVPFISETLANTVFIAMAVVAITLPSLLLVGLLMVDLIHMAYEEILDYREWRHNRQGWERK